MRNSNATWINIEKAGVYNTIWQIKSIYTVPPGFAFQIKYISWICDVTKAITISNLSEYNGSLYIGTVKDPSNFYVLPTFAHFPYPFNKRVSENDVINIYFDSSTSDTFDYLIIRLSGWLISKIEDALEDKEVLL
jgi:hypothetical protein